MFDIHPFHLIFIRKAILLRQGYPYKDKHPQSRHRRKIEEIHGMPSRNTLDKLILLDDSKLSFSKDTLNRIVWYIISKDDDIFPIGHEVSKIQNFWTTFENYFAAPKYYKEEDYAYLNEVPNEVIQKMSVDLDMLLDKKDIRKIGYNTIKEKTYSDIENIFKEFPSNEQNEKYPRFSYNLPGLYYSYFIDTKTPSNLVRVTSKIELLNGKLAFEYKTQKQKYETKIFDLEDDQTIFIRLKQCTFPFTNINFNLKYYGDLLIGHYSTLDNNHHKNIPVSGLEIFIKKSDDFENEGKFTSKRIYGEEDIEDEIEKELLRFSKNQEFQPNISNSIIESIDDIININKESDLRIRRPLKRLFDNKWSLFYLHEQEKVLVRAILEFIDNGEIHLENISESDSGEPNIFIGSFKYNNNILILDLQNETRNKPLQIILRIGTSNFDLAAGMWHDVDDNNSIIGGTTIIQRNESNNIILPRIYKNYKEVVGDVPHEIIDFFISKTKNFTRVPSKISSIASLNSFLKDQKEKSLKDDKTYYKYDFYIGSQILTKKRWRNFNLLKQVIEGMTLTLQEKYDKNSFWLGNRINNKLVFKMRTTNLRSDFIEILEDSKSYIAIIENTLSTGLFSELSIAIILGKPCTIFVKHDNLLPYALQNMMTTDKNRIKKYTFSNYKKLLTLIDKLVDEESTL